MDGVYLLWNAPPPVASMRSNAGRPLHFDMSRYDRISIDPAQMGGAPCIRHLRIPVATIVGLVAEGRTNEQILTDYPDLQPEDIAEALEYAAEAVRERQLPLKAG